MAIEGIEPSPLQLDRVREDFEKFQLIFQFLESRGLEKSLAILQAETGIEFEISSTPQGGILDTLIDDYIGMRATGLPQKSASDDLPEPGFCATEIQTAIPNIHGTANPTCLTWSTEGEDIIVTGGVDKRLLFHRDDGEYISELTLPSPVLCVDWSRDTIIVGCMGGEVALVSVIDVSSPELVSISKPHGHARVTHVEFGDSFYVSVAKDVKVWEVLSNKECRTIRCERDVSSVCWINDDVLVVAEVDNPILKLHDVKQGLVLGELCMNKNLYDPRTAYTTLKMAFHETCRLLIASTTRNSVLLFKLPVFEENAENPIVPIRTLYGMSIGIYDVPSLCFSLDGTHIYTSSDKEIIVFETKSGHKIFNIPISDSKPVRGFTRQKSTDRLATVSFDRFMKIVA